MPDSDALRQRRRKKHAAGDHSLCQPSRCAAAAAALIPAGADAAPVRLGGVSESVLTAVSEFGFPGSDPRFVIMVVTLQLAMEFDKKPTVTCAAEIRRNMIMLMDHAAEAPTELDAVRARVKVKQAEFLLGAAFGGHGGGLASGSEAEVVRKLSAWRPGDEVTA